MKKAFTLIELLVVISIITITSASGIFYFIDFVKKQELSQKTNIINNYIKELDYKVKKYNILDYQLHFNSSELLNKYYISYTNIFDNLEQTLEINSSGTGTIKTNSSGTGTIKTNSSGTGTIKIYKNNKLFIQKIINRTTDFNIGLESFIDYKITGTLESNILNNIYINYISGVNSSSKNTSLVKLLKISSDENGDDLGSIIIENIGGNKKIYNNLNEYNTIFLWFENNGIIENIKLINK